MAEEAFAGAGDAVEPWLAGVLPSGFSGVAVSGADCVTPGTVVDGSEPGSRFGGAAGVGPGGDCFSGLDCGVSGGLGLFAEFGAWS